MALTIKATITRYQRNIDIAQLIYNQLPLVDQIIIVIRDYLQEQDVIAVIVVARDGKG